MSTQGQDPIVESLDRLAGTADADPVGDRMPDIKRRVRVARQRRVTGLAVTATAAVIAGPVAWQALGQQQSAPPVAPTRDTHQNVTIVARGIGPEEIRIKVRIAGEATVVPDSTNGGPAAGAGPQRIQVLVDGTQVEQKQLAAPGASCESGVEVAPYQVRYPRKRSIVADVSGAGEHTVEVRAPYCAHGQVVNEPTQVVVATKESLTTQRTLDTDVDDDGRDDTVRLLVPTAGGDEMRLEVDRTAGGNDDLRLPYDSEYTLEDPVDLDGDGRPELILHGGAGETSSWEVVRVTDDAIVPVRTVNTSGDDEPLAFGLSEGQPLDQTWQIALTPSGFYSFRYVDAFPTRPAPVEVRAWTLSEDGLTLRDATTPGCVGADFRLRPGGC